MEVTVYEDLTPNVNPRIVFNYNNGSNMGSCPLTYYDAYDPDVVLTVDIWGAFHALVVYYSPSVGDFVLEDFSGTTGFGSIPGTVSFRTSVSYGTSVNIDADYNGYFVIVWDEGGIPYAQVGDVVNGSLAIVLNNVPIGTVGFGTNPDVCLSSATGNDRVIYCYLDNGDLFVEEDSFFALYTSSVAGTFANPLFQHTPADVYYDPRISCLDPTIGAVGDWWSVVVLDTDFSTSWQIRGHTYTNLSGVHSDLYNDSHWISGGTNYTTLPCYAPAVTYDDQGNIFVGFSIDNSTGNFAGALTWATYPIVVACAPDGYPHGLNYWEEPEATSFNTGDVRDYLSLSGRHGNDVIFSSYYDINNLNVQTKAVYSSIPWGSLRTQSIQPIANDQLNYLQSNPSTKIIANIYDLSGKLTSQYNGEYGNFNKHILDNLPLKSNQIYLINILSEDGSIKVQKKIYTN